MALRIPRWITRTGVVVAGIAAVGSAVTRKVNLREEFIGQMAAPHGPLGWLAAVTMPMAHRVFYAPAADLLRLQPDDELVDVACGSGVFLYEHASRVRRVAGLDISSIQVRLAGRRLTDRIEAGTAEIVEGDALELPWDDESFSAATCLGSLEGISDPAAALLEMRRVLRPGGRLVVSYGIDQSNADFVRQTEKWGIPNPPEEEARKIVEDAGFSLVSVTYLEGDYPARLLSGVKPE